MLESITKQESGSFQGSKEVGNRREITIFQGVEEKSWTAGLINTALNGTCFKVRINGLVDTNQLPC